LNQKSRDDAYEGAVVAVEDISLTFGSRDIFTNFSLEARAGDFIAITGSSGTGKSSILRIMCGIQDATSGGARIHGMEISKLSREARAKLRRDSVSFLAQGDGPIDHLTFREYFGDFTASYLENFHSRKDRRLSGFSGGERARIEIYKMLSQNRKVLMFDEPTSQLDEKHSIEIAELLADHVEVGGIVITSTRDESLLSCATKIISLDIT
jgi:putative ABC transport system ATP-binding protein